ncbi:uncharacterized protein LOC132190242 [Corylus avellana]|uniref:uncharacterized protein LOC132190242 n=1 Tax=Corylus avellana TaxID=13451 RepID=UPI00286CE2BD|nr:uncharacterized protein LOC132190242 [Corylus avellana]
MKGREAKPAPSTDLLVCFPSRAHLTLMPKPICSPARPSEPNKRHHHHHHLKKPSSRGGGGQASPLLWAKTKPMGSDISEPTSPKVTCAGQIKVRPKAGSCKSWQTVMEEIERIHNSRKPKKRPGWVESLGFKKDIMQFLTCLRSIRFDFRCFGSFPESSDITTDDEDGGEDEDQEYRENRVGAEGIDGNGTDSRTVFSKWFMVLQENQNNKLCREDKKDRDRGICDNESVAEPAAPPPNALLLMRCRSAPAKGWLEKKEEEEEEEEKEAEDEHEKAREKEQRKAKSLKSLMEEEKRTKKENMVVMKYDTDFYKISSDIAKETWVAGGTRDPFSRSRSWKR